MKRLKEFLASRAAIRFYRVGAFGVLALVLMQIAINLAQIEVDVNTKQAFMIIITGWIAGIDKQIRSPKSLEDFLMENEDNTRKFLKEIDPL